MTSSEPIGLPIEVRALTKSFGPVAAINDLSFTVQPGQVTGFLGPNGAGKTTTLRILLGLVRPTSGVGLIGGRPYVELERPATVVGASLEATGFHPGRTARNHLVVLATASQLDLDRVDFCLDLVGLTEAAKRRVGGFSLGMRQRLALASALLGDPGVLLLDEPANGLDPEGIAWLRGFLRQLAAEGRTVLVSSHVLSEVSQTVDEVVIISKGKLVRQSRLDELSSGPVTFVRGPDTQGLLAALKAAGKEVASTSGELLRVIDSSSAQVGKIAFAAGLELHELRGDEFDLESAFLALTGDRQSPAQPQPKAEVAE